MKAWWRERVAGLKTLLERRRRHERAQPLTEAMNPRTSAAGSE
jgi:hypothetical protein